MVMQKDIVKLKKLENQHAELKALFDRLFEDLKSALDKIHEKNVEIKNLKEEIQELKAGILNDKLRANQDRS